MHNTGFCLQAANSAVLKAVENPSAFFIKNKHLSFSRGTWAKFDSADIAEVQGWVAQALKSDKAVFMQNGLRDTFKVEVDTGRVIGTQGQTGIRIIVSNDGRVINALPVNP
ncbi:hypothetical protein [Kitasatospora setae]|uniref:hypothetical protein n=1 Tax=Kitasatospora setae TaxID=2066 RepID=UPI0011D29FB5|nr:hypothetical protein [Kitasatospora setae]